MTSCGRLRRIDATSAIGPRARQRRRRGGSRRRSPERDARAGRAARWPSRPVVGEADRDVVGRWLRRCGLGRLVGAIDACQLRWSGARLSQTRRSARNVGSRPAGSSCTRRRTRRGRVDRVDERRVGVAGVDVAARPRAASRRSVSVVVVLPSVPVTASIGRGPPAAPAPTGRPVRSRSDRHAGRGAPRSRVVSGTPGAGHEIDTRRQPVEVASRVEQLDAELGGAVASVGRRRRRRRRRRSRGAQRAHGRRAGDGEP